MNKGKLLNVIIIDDEIEILKGLKSLVQWEQYGFTVVLSTTKVQEVLNYQASSIDLLITDISMPKMDGFELIKHLRNINPLMKSILITCHQSFEYLKEGMMIGIEDYIVKHTISSTILLHSLIKIKNKIDGEYEINKKIFQLDAIEKSETNEFQKLLYNFLENQSVTALDIKNKGIKTPSIFNYSAVLFLSLSENNNKIIHLKGFKYISLSIRELIYKIFDTKLMYLVYFGTDNNVYLFLYNNPKEITVIALLKQLRASIHNLLNLNASICCSETNTNFENLRVSFLHLQNQKKHFFYEDTHFIKINTQALIPSPFTDKYEKQIGYFYATFIVNLHDINENKQHLLMDEMFSFFYDNKINPLSLLELLKKLLSVIYINTMNKTSHVNLVLSYTENFNLLKEDFMQKVDEYYKADKIQLKTRYSQSIIKAISYIEDHIDEKITCKFLANLVNLDRSYFSRLFKSELNKTLSDYIKDKKIEYTKILLKNSDLGIEEIAFKLGFPNSQNFCRMIKKNTGLSPLNLKKIL